MTIKTNQIKSTTVQGAMDEISKMNMDLKPYADKLGCGVRDVIEAIATQIIYNDEDYDLERALEDDAL